MTDAIEAAAVALSWALGDHDVARDAARDALSAYHEWLEANGYAVVPVEATEAMLDAYTAYSTRRLPRHAYTNAADDNDGPAAMHIQPAAYRAMIAAAKEQQ